MKQIPFLKIHGTGNDFIVVDNRYKIFPESSQAVISQLCDRHFGIGADGLLLLEDSPTVDFRMVYYNSDGAEAMMCGNGARCICYFAYKKGIVEKELIFEARDGIHHARVQEGRVRLQMIPPTQYREILLGIELPDEWKLGGFINTGVEHLVVWVNQLDQVPVLDWGKKLRWSPALLPMGANIDFIESPDNQQIHMRTYERGVENETLSCGTGVTASALIASRSGRIHPPVTVHTKGGELVVDFDEHFEEVYLEGPVETIFEGVFNIKTFDKKDSRRSK